MQLQQLITNLYPLTKTPHDQELVNRYVWECAIQDRQSPMAAVRTARIALESGKRPTVRDGRVVFASILGVANQ